MTELVIDGPARRRRRQGDPARASTSTVRSGEVHAVMGPNGSGKSTLSHVLMGKPGYEVTGGSVTLDGVDLLALATVGAGPGRPVPGHAVPDRGARRVARRRAQRGVRRRRAAIADDGRRRSCGAEADAHRASTPRFLDRPLNVDLSGGEKKRNETLQLGGAAPEDRHPRRDRLRSRRRRPAGGVAGASSAPPRFDGGGLGVLAITHYSRLLEELHPDVVHIFARVGS